MGKKKILRTTYLLYSYVVLLRLQHGIVFLSRDTGGDWPQSIELGYVILFIHTGATGGRLPLCSSCLPFRPRRGYATRASDTESVTQLCAHAVISPSRDFWIFSGHVLSRFFFPSLATLSRSRFSPIQVKKNVSHDAMHSRATFRLSSTHTAATSSHVGVHHGGDRPL